MHTISHFLIFLLAGLGYCQLPTCHNFDGSKTADFPCDPHAAVSACCPAGYTCQTSLYCSLGSTEYVGSCTDKDWASPACPFNLGASSFNRALDTTTCNDGTVCPSSRNETCCHNHQGIKEIMFHYDKPFPSNPADLNAYYATLTSASEHTQTASPTTLSTGQPTASASGAAASTVTPTSIPIPSNGSSRIDPGTVAGLGVGAAIFIWLSACMLYYYISNREPKKTRHWYKFGHPAASRKRRQGEKYYQFMNA